MVQTAPVLLDTVALGKAGGCARSGGGERGEMQDSLLGMSYLQRFDRLEISGGTLVLER
jgi:aspartyl protease family protein